MPLIPPLSLNSALAMVWFIREPEICCLLPHVQHSTYGAAAVQIIFYLWALPWTSATTERRLFTPAASLPPFFSTISLFALFLLSTTLLGRWVRRGALPKTNDPENIPTTTTGR
jgi:hypothetical protein